MLKQPMAACSSPGKMQIRFGNCCPGMACSFSCFSSQPAAENWLFSIASRAFASCGDSCVRLSTTRNPLVSNWDLSHNERKVDETMTTTTRNIRDNRIMADLYSEDGQIPTGKTRC